MASSSRSSSSSSASVSASTSVTLRPLTRVNAKLRGTFYKATVLRIVQESVHARVQLRESSKLCAKFLKPEVITIAESSLQGEDPRRVGSKVVVVGGGDDDDCPNELEHRGQSGRVLAVIDKSSYLVRFAGDGVRRTMKRVALRCLTSDQVANEEKDGIEDEDEGEKEEEEEEEKETETMSDENKDEKNDDHEGVEDDEDEAEKKKEEEEMEEKEAEQDKVDAKDKKGNSKERKEVVEKRVETEEERRERRARRQEFYADLVLGKYKNELKHILPEQDTDNENDDNDDDDDSDSEDEAGREAHLARIEQRLQVGETVSVVCGSGRVSPWMKSNVFKAKIVRKEPVSEEEEEGGRPFRFKVHFVGWNRRHDKWITVEELYEARIRPVPLRWLIKRYGPTGRRPREPEEEEQQEEDEEEFADENIQA